MSVKIHVGDCRVIMAGMEAGSVHSVITSPPYWKLRSYLGDDHPDKVNEIGSESTPQEYVAAIVEVSRGVRRVLRDDGIYFLNLGDGFASGQGSCRNPGGGKNSLGKTKKNAGAHPLNRGNKSDLTRVGLKPKDLIGIPWRCALALQADGWYLRSAMPWVKLNPMPESVRDRVTTAHEYIFMLTKKKRYFYDSESVKMPASISGWQKERDKGIEQSYKRYHTGESSTLNTIKSNGTRNRRTSDTFYESLDIRIAQQRQYLAHLEHVRANGGMLTSEDGTPAALLVNTASYSGKHFAVFPLKLVKPLIACSTSERGVCPKCGAQWARVVEKTFVPQEDIKNPDKLAKSGLKGMDCSNSWGDMPRGHNNTTTTGWKPTCTCYDDYYRATYPQAKSARKRHQRHISGDWLRRVWNMPNMGTVPATVFDPFSGAGTTLLQADRMNRDAIGCELNETYATKLAYERIAGDVPMFADVEILTQNAS